MKKKLAAVVSAGALAGIIGFGQGSAAVACTGSDGETHTSGETTQSATAPGRGPTTVYGDFDEAAVAGHLGVNGDIGYIELEGSQGTGLQVDGNGTAGGQTIDGRLTVSTSPGICVNGTGV